MSKLLLLTSIFIVTFVFNNTHAQWIQTNFSSKYSPNYILSYKNNLYVSAFQRLVVDTGGVFRSTDLGNNWMRITDDLPSQYFGKIIAYSKGLTDYIFAISDSGIFCSSDNGNSWSLKNSIGSNGISNIDQVDGILFATRFAHTYRSTDDGENWQEVFFNSINRAVSSVTKTNNNYIAIMGEGTSDFLYSSSDFGVTWNKVQSNFSYTGNQITSVSNNLYASAYTVILKSTDDGLNWNMMEGIPSGYYYKKLKSYGDYLFCVHMTGIYFQHKDSTNWRFVSNALMPSFLSCGEIDENYIYAGKYDSLIYRRSLSEVFTDVEEQPTQPTEFKLEQNYPNPFNPGTTISWQSSIGSWQTIKMFNSLGQEVATIVDGYYEAGVHSKLYIANSSLPSGVYFYQLKAGDFLETRKMILMK
jgi:photosystem II stability/assembly factor-like uncharacterized protein